ncbi:MAG: gamma-glutamyltransferase [Myxococcales bacterium]|nr:gamma-glutamyltransferase [Myxococcales bacterium]
MRVGRVREGATRGCIAAGHPLTAAAGEAIFAAGGNAFDAALAALCMACVAEPVLASLGGGGFFLAHDGGGRTLVYDAFAQTPRQKRELAGIDFQPVIADFGVAQQEFHIGLGSVATPGLVRGIFAVHRAHGSLPIAEIVAPAVAAAREGLTLTPFQAYILETIAPIYGHTPAARAIFTRGPDDPRVRGAGERLVNPGLADLLEALAREGDALFYEGEVAAAIEALSRAEGGHLTREDLRSYRVIAREPLQLRYRDATLATNPPPSAGGLLIAFGLGLLAGLDVAGLGAGTPAQARVLAEAMVHTRDARRRHGAIPALLDPALLAGHAAALAELAAAPPMTRGTTHISAIDAAGNAAAITVSNGEGCGHLVPGTGTMLNNMLGEEDINPEGFHAWAPDVRMSSMMAPTAIFADDGRLAVLGSGGSKRIRTAILQVLVNLLDNQMTIAAAIAAPRLHLDAERLNFEAAGMAPATAEALAAAFADHAAWPERNMYFGGVHAAMREADGRLHGAGDPRRAGVCVVA